MAAAEPTWFALSDDAVGMLVESALSKGLGASSADGFCRVLMRLLRGAFSVLREIVVEKGSDIGDVDLYEAASLLSSRLSVEEYRFPAYLFAVSLCAVCFFGRDIEDTEHDDFDVNELFKFDSTAIVGGKDACTKQLKRFSIRLLDFSRTNQLVHFRPIKSATLGLVSPDVNRTLRYLSSAHGARVYLSGWKKFSPVLTYKCKYCGRLAELPYDFSAKKSQPSMECPVCDIQSTHNRKSMQPIKEKLVCLPDIGYVCDCGEVIGDIRGISAPIACPRCGTFIEKDFSPIVLAKDLAKYKEDELVPAVGDILAKETAKTLMNKSKNMERNFGLHVLYLACGFLKWRDLNGTEYNSPILLAPINLSVDRKAGRYYFEMDASSNGEFELNRTLIQMLSAYSPTCSITLPEVNEKNIYSYFGMLKRTFADSGDEIADITKNWRVDAEFGMGLFHYQKLQLQNDIESNFPKYMSHPVIRRLCGDTDAKIAPTANTERHSLKYMMLNADSSQDEVIKASQEGKSFILQGPPGSGKSQTITNIISSALGEGKTVLFVTEKASARSVIIDNIKNAGSDEAPLLDFVLDFEGFKTRGGAIGRDPFVRELNAVLDSGFTSYGGYDDAVISEEQFLHSEISRFMHEMRDPYDGRMYMRLLYDTAEFAEFEEIKGRDLIPADGVKFNELCNNTNKFFTLRAAAGSPLDYRDDPLYGCTGDPDGRLVKNIDSYLSALSDIRSAVLELNSYGWSVSAEQDAVRLAVAALEKWENVPRLTREVIGGFDAAKAKRLTNHISNRMAELTVLKNHDGKKYLSKLNSDKVLTLDPFTYSQLIKAYKPFFKRIGKSYKNFLEAVRSCLRTPPEKLTYKEASSELRDIFKAHEYLTLQNRNERSVASDKILFGEDCDSEAALTSLSDRIETFSAAAHNTDRVKLIPDSSFESWMSRFCGEDNAAMRGTVSSILSKLRGADPTMASAPETFKKYFIKSAVPKKYPSADFENLLGRVKSNASRLSDWGSFMELISEISRVGHYKILEELWCDGVKDASLAIGRLSITYRRNVLRSFEEKHGLRDIKSFKRRVHTDLMAKYASSDTAVLKGGARRVYETLRTRLASFVPSGFKLQSKTGYSIKQTIYENREYIRCIKPCFMMSPLNVSQYIDADMSFDLVIFDEASQVFTEDALAAILRGKQIIIAGDSKQLPPCDFFRAGESNADEGDGYVDDEINHDFSLLTAADSALNDSSISLAWHYRSCDEALIAFANKEMDYNLITFPSAKKNANDGIRYIEIPYSPSTCYTAGKGASHINKGEADRIVKLIAEEMSHPERCKYSIGVVAFSNAQAFEIEERWEIYKQNPTVKPIVDKWESEHADEPLIFCNLDTVQGDERDTTILSICYSEDSKGKFILPYLGRIRLLTGKKRINVAVTRARHQMIVVSTLKAETLRMAINISSAPEENKAGAQMLCNLLEYARGFVDNRDVVSMPSRNPFVRSVAEILLKNGVDFDTEIGRSDCKISIGIRNPMVKGDYILGIIIDDPSRSDFDSVREYARLTEEVLTRKYGWSVYRIYPISWVTDYKTEVTLLLDAIRNAYSSV